MAGIRLHHPTLRGVTLTVQHPQRYSTPIMCSRCGQAHGKKTYHLDLDSNGDVIVSPAVLDKLKTIQLAGMLIINEVPKPPPLVVGLNSNGEVTKVVRYKGGE